MYNNQKNRKIHPVSPPVSPPMSFSARGTLEGAHFLPV